MSKIWVVVAESSRARIFTVDHPNKSLQELETLSHPEGRLHERELTSDLPGRDSDKTGSGHHAMDAKTSPKEQELIEFSHQICQHLDSARTRIKGVRPLFCYLIVIMGYIGKTHNNALKFVLRYGHLTRTLGSKRKNQVREQCTS